MRLKPSLALAVALIVGAAALPALGAENSATDPEHRFTPAAVAYAAPAAIDVSDLAFSESVDDRNRPRDPKVEFDSTTEDVSVSFDYRNNSGSQLSYLVRANGEDWSWGDLDCCDGSQGRYAFQLRRKSGKDLGGAAYEVMIYADDAELAHGGFGVRGTQGFDSDSQSNGNENGNDNN